MNIVQLTPGAGNMFCGNCLRDNAFVAAARALGHEALMIPLYLPLTLDEQDQSAGTPIFFSGINVYLEQKSAWFRRAPAWLHRWLASPSLLRWAAGRAAKTRASELGELTLSMLRGESGNQVRELNELIAWLRAQAKPDVICLSNVLLIGMARRLQAELGSPVLCMLQGEDTFLDALPEPFREACWKTIAERAHDVDRFISPSHYFAKYMGARLGLAAGHVEVVHNGINLQGYPGETASNPGGNSDSTGPVLGYFARMCREKGLPSLVDAFILLKQRGSVPGLKLHVGGSCGPTDTPVVQELRDRLQQAGYLEQASFFPNLDRTQKIAFLEKLTVFSVPALYGEAFGLYLLEALAAGVPVVQPRTAAFTELVEATGGGVLCPAGDVRALADALESLLKEPQRARALGVAGRKAVWENFSVEAMTRSLLTHFEAIAKRKAEALHVG